MRLIVFTSLTMLAFAGNSLLTRAALKGAKIDAADFASIRLFSGAAMLLLIVVLSKQKLPKAGRKTSLMAVSLLVYVLGFSYAYLELDAGIGALILFGGVQLTMMIGAHLTGAALNKMQIIGGVIAFAGLVILFMPSELNMPMGASLLMGLAALGWGVYSLLGKSVQSPLPVTALNFAAAFPIAFLLSILAPNDIAMTREGVGLAVLSGAVTSGLGYALWYSILPRLGGAVAATVQLSVPVIAIGLGAVFLNEAVSLRMAVSALLVILGIALSIYASQNAAGQ